MRSKAGIVDAHHIALRPCQTCSPHFMYHYMNIHKCISRSCNTCLGEWHPLLMLMSDTRSATYLEPSKAAVTPQVASITSSEHRMRTCTQVARETTPKTNALKEDMYFNSIMYTWIVWRLTVVDDYVRQHMEIST